MSRRGRIARLLRILLADRGWRIVHQNFARQTYTLERDRRFFKGRYIVVTHRQLREMPIRGIAA